MSWIAVGAMGGAALGGAAGYFGSKGKNKVDPYGQMTSEQRALNSAVGGDLLANANKNYTYGGQLTEGIGAGEQDVVNQNARMNAIAGNTYANLGNYNDPAFNEQFDSEISRPTLQNFQNEIAPYLAQELPSFGTQRAQVIARSMGELQNNVLQKRFDARESAKNRALQASNDSANYFNTSAGIQSIPRSIKQAGLDREYANFVKANEQKSDSLKNALSFLGISMGTSEYKPNSTGAALSGAMAGASSGAGLMNLMGGGGGGGLTPQTLQKFGGGVTPQSFSARSRASMAPNLTISGY